MAPQRNLDIRWRSISLLLKNQTPNDSPFHERVVHTLGLLRVMEAVRAGEGDEPIGELYRVYGQHIHHEKDTKVDPATALREAGLSSGYAHAFDDPSWDTTIRTSMDEGLALTGNDVGTPLLAFDSPAGRVGFFGPVISRRMPITESLQLWDGVVAAATIPGFWELKRTRTESPNFDPPGP